MCQVLHQTHPFYSHSSDRKNHLPFKKPDSSPSADTCVGVPCRHITIPFLSSQQSTARACGERRLHVRALWTLTLGWMWGEALCCRARPPEGRNPLWGRNALRGWMPTMGRPAGGRYLLRGYPPRGRPTVGNSLRWKTCWENRDPPWGRLAEESPAEGISPEGEIPLRWDHCGDTPQGWPAERGTKLHLSSGDWYPQSSGLVTRGFVCGCLWFPAGHGRHFTSGPWRPNPLPCAAGERGGHGASSSAAWRAGRGRSGGGALPPGPVCVCVPPARPPRLPEPDSVCLQRGRQLPSQIRCRRAGESAETPVSNMGKVGREPGQRRSPSLLPSPPAACKPAAAPAGSLCEKIAFHFHTFTWKTSL